MEKHIAAIYDVSTVADLIHVLQTFQYGTFPVVCKYNEPIDLLEPVDEARTIKHDPRFPPKVVRIHTPTHPHTVAVLYPTLSYLLSYA